MNTTIPVALILAMTGCAGSEGGYEMAMERAACAVENAEKSGLGAEQLCSAFVEGFAAAGGNPDMRLVLSVASATSLDVRIEDPAGTQHEPMTFDVVDAEMREEVLKAFGADLARSLARRAARDG